jgi:PAS domain S-box-containing protein
MSAVLPSRRNPPDASGSPAPPSAGPLGWRARLRRWLVARYSPQARLERDATGRRLGALFERSGEGLLICGREGQIVACNPVAAQAFGDAPGQLVGQALAGRVVQPTAAGSRRLHSGHAKLRRADGQLLPVELRFSELPGPPRSQWLVQVRDLSDRQRAEDRLLHLANFDSLTGLPNRALFRDRLAGAMQRARATGQPLALMFLDLDRFKFVNDSLGHETGDRLLQHVGRTLSRCLRGSDALVRSGAAADAEGAGTGSHAFTVSRLGGDEFTVIAEGIGSSEDAGLIAQRLLDALGAPFVSAGEEIVVSASIGITTYPADDVDLDTLVRHTDMAMYRAKSLGRGMYCFFSDDLSAAVTARLSLEGSLRRALERDEFVLNFQPKANLASGEVTGVEALLRWHCPGRGMVPPDRFIAVLEETGLILPVGAWVIRTALAQLAAWDQEGLPPLRMAVNISARQFRHQYLASLVADSLREYGLEPARLEIEITESLLMEDNEATRTMLANFKRLGLKLALDDFGTGHSSLAYLRRFHLHTLKIDRSFVSALPNNVEDTAIARAVVALGHSMNMNVVAEGVETMEQARALAELGCEEIQGYLLSRPLPAAELGPWMAGRIKAPMHTRFGDAPSAFQRLDINIDDGEVCVNTEPPRAGAFTFGSLESAHANEHGERRREPAAARAEPGAARGGDAAAAAGADPGRSGFGQDARAHHADRLAAGTRPRLAGAGVRGDLHEQGRQGDADAPVGDAADQRARDVDRHLPRPGQPLLARALEAGRAAAELPDP